MSIAYNGAEVDRQDRPAGHSHPQHSVSPGFLRSVRNQDNVRCDMDMSAADVL